MNKKGFTTVELILTLAVVMVVMTTIISVTFNYRDQSSYEQTVTELNNYKNNVTKIIYDDIFDIREDEESRGKVVKIEKLNPDDNTKYKLITNIESDTYYLLEVIDRDVTRNEREYHEVGVIYDGDEYIIPGADHAYVELRDIVFKSKEESGSNLYVLDINYNNKKISKPFKIHIIV